MTTDTTSDMTDEPGHDTDAAVHDDWHGSHGLTDLGYVQVAVALAIITGLEVFASYTDWLGRAFLPILLVLMIVKFFSVVLFFMHLRFDSKIFSALFYAGPVPRRRRLHRRPLHVPLLRRVTAVGVGAGPGFAHRRSVPIRLASRGLAARRVPDRRLRVHGARDRPARRAVRPTAGEPSPGVLLRRPRC